MKLIKNKYMKMKAKLVNENLNQTIISGVFADWKDIEGLAESFKEALKKFNIFVYDDPDTEGSNTYGFILSNKPLSRKDLKDMSYESYEEKQLQIQNLPKITHALVSFLDKHKFKSQERKDYEYVSEKIHNYAENAGIEFSNEEALDLAKQYDDIKSKK